MLGDRSPCTAGSRADVGYHLDSLTVYPPPNDPPPPGVALENFVTRHEVYTKVMEWHANSKYGMEDEYFFAAREGSE